MNVNIFFLKLINDKVKILTQQIMGIKITLIPKVIKILGKEVKDPVLPKISNRKSKLSQFCCKIINIVIKTINNPKIEMNLGICFIF